MSCLKTFRYLISLCLVLIGASCNTTLHLNTGQYLLRKNNVKLNTDKGITHRGELQDNIDRLVAQKTNTYALGIVPYKVWFYNLRYNKYAKDTSNFQFKIKTVERPVAYDSVLRKRSAANMKSYLFNQGYFYPQVTDTVKFKGKKAYVTYNVTTGTNFLINKVNLDIDDSTIKAIIQNTFDQSSLKKGQEFSMSLLESERSRITNLLRENGYYKFAQENIVDFSLDTFNKSLLRNAYNPFETAINFIALQKKEKEKPTLDITILIRKNDNFNAYKKYEISSVSVYPDFISRDDVTDPTMKEMVVNNIKFRYHKYYIRPMVMAKHIYFEPGKIYSQNDYDNTINYLNRLGVFQNIRIILAEDTTKRDAEHGYLRAIILLTPSDKMDYGVNFEISNGTTYTLGSALILNFRNRNLGKGANMFTTTVSGGIESFYDESKGSNFFEHFRLLTKNIGFNASIDFPKFLFPFTRNITRKNLPRTLIGGGYNLLERVNYFTLSNLNANFTYNWRQNKTNTWDVSPVFMNIIRLPSVSDSFQQRLTNNDFLKNSYRETFIEGENIAFTYSNQTIKKGKSYNYLRVAVEEAGSLVSLINTIAPLKFQFSQYLRFDFDARRYINRFKSQTAIRFYGGIGIPYDKSSTLPYIKQYFVGGAYSIRGWRIRTLGPGGYKDTVKQTNQTRYIDRTGDIKLEVNAEYRFDLIQLFSGSIKLKGAVFADCGNIWLARPSADYPDGEFNFSRLGRDFAISTGAGARFDIAGFFVFRLDAAFPIKKPYLSNGGWVIDDLHFDKGSWRSDNIILNFAIGYPF